jgi:hypothetical protein
MKVTTDILLVDDKPGDTDPIVDTLKRKDRNLTGVHSVPAGTEAMAVLHCEGMHANPLAFHLTTWASSYVMQAGRSAQVCVGGNNDRRFWLGSERTT